LLAAFMSTFAATVNAAPAYVVNDIYKRYVNPHADDRTYVMLSYTVSILFVVFGTTIGLFVESINQVVQWLVSALYGGYTASNVLKWYWWRFNGYGYFVGMLTGIAVAIPLIFMDVSPLHAFPFLFAACFFASIVGCLVTEAEDMAVIKEFYRKTRPWGFWKPVINELQRESPQLQANHNFALDSINVVIGIIWQSALAAFAIFLVTRNWIPFTASLGVIVVTSVILNYTWMNRIQDYPADLTNGFES
jgi:Na+/proline symporter